jgi:L-alanine-DL-glutamate epimerase-like enolase superfamily enzyme
MRITRVQPFLLSFPFPEPLKFRYYGGERTILKRDAMLIRIETDGGLVGYAPGQASEKGLNAVEAHIRPFLEGRIASDPDAMRIRFLEGPGSDPELAKLYIGVEIGLYDLWGKIKAVPVSELLGGRVRDRIRLYGSAGMYMPPERYAEEAYAISRLGFGAYKMRPALGPDEDARTIRLMREATGPDFDLMVDAHTWWRMGDRSYGFETVKSLAREFASHRIAWLEEPLPPDDHAAYRRLAEEKILPLASGEHEPDEEGYRDLIANRCVDIVQSDMCCQCGYAAGRRLLAAVAAAGMSFAFHSWGTDLEVIAAAHLGICWPETVTSWLEYPCYSTGTRAGMYPFPLASEILRKPLGIEGGNLTVPRTPGLGVEIDESVVDRYPWIPGPWSYFRLDSPPETWAVISDHSVRWAGQA